MDQKHQSTVVALLGGYLGIGVMALSLMPHSFFAQEEASAIRDINNARALCLASEHVDCSVHRAALNSIFDAAVVLADDQTAQSLSHFSRVLKTGDAQPCALELSYALKDAVTVLENYCNHKECSISEEILLNKARQYLTLYSVRAPRPNAPTQVPADSELYPLPRDLNVDGDLFVGGQFTASNITLAGNLDVPGTLTAGDIVLTGDLNVPGTLTAGAFTLTGDLNVPGTLTAGDFTLLGDLHVPGNLSVDGTTTVNDTNIVDGILAVKQTVGSKQLDIGIDGEGTAPDGYLGTRTATSFVMKASSTSGAITFEPLTNNITLSAASAGTVSFDPAAGTIAINQSMSTTSAPTFTGASLSNQGQLKLYEATGGGTDFVAIQAPAALGASYTLTLPTTAGTNGYALTTNGSGVLGWSPFAAGSYFANGGNAFGVASAILGTTDAFGLRIQTEGADRITIANTAGSGAIAIPAFTVAGVVHNAITTGVLSSSLIVNADVDAAAGIVDTKLATISTALKVSNSATTATAANTASAIVARDASGNFAAGTVSLENQGQLKLYEATAGGTNFAAIQAPAALGVDYTLTLPTTAGTNGYALTTNGSGVLSWASLAPAGSYFANGGNAFGVASAILGTTDAFGLRIQTEGADRITIANTAGSGIVTIPSAVYADGGIDVTATAGTDTLNIGTTNAEVINLGTASTVQTINMGTGTGVTTINIGGAGDTVNIGGTLTWVKTTDLQVTDKLITINKDGAVASGDDAGIQIEENAVNTAYAKTGNTRASWLLKAPATAGIVTITPGASGFTLNQGVATTDSPSFVGLTLSGMTVAGIVHNAVTTGILSSSLIVDADVHASAGIVDTKLATISTALKVSNSATTATAANTASAIVARDGSGNFAAGTITATALNNIAGAVLTVGTTDAFALNLVTNGTTRLSIDSSGNTTYGSKYKAAAYVGTNITPATAVSTIVFGTENYDTNPSYDNTTGIYTAPVTGFYFVTAQVCAQIGEVGTKEISVFLNGTVTVIPGAQARIVVPTLISSDSGTDTRMINLTTIVSLTAADTIRVRYSGATADTLLADSSSFAVHYMSFTPA